MKNFRAFKIETIGATNTEPARVKITDLRFAKSVKIGHSNAPGAGNPDKDTAENFLNSKGIEVIAHAWSEDKNSRHQFTILLSDNFTHQIN